MRDATDYYNLFSDTLKNGNNQIKYLYDKINYAKQEGKYINIRTGCLIQEKDFHTNNYYFNYNYEFPLCYNFSCCGLARKRVIKRIMDFYLSCLKEFDRDKDEEKMKERIKKEIELAKKNYEYLNKNNNGFDDLKLFNIPPHLNEPKEEEYSFNTSSFINDDNSNSQENNSFIDDNDIEEENEEEEDNKEDKIENEEKENKKKKKGKLIKNGKKVVNEYKKELDDLLDENYDGEDELNKVKEESEEEDELDLNSYSFKKKSKTLHKKNYLNKKTKRNVIDDSDEEENEKEEEKKENNKEEEKIDEENISQEIKNLLKEEENEEFNNNKTENKKVEDSINKEYYKGLKEKINMRQGTLDAFLKIKI